MTAPSHFRILPNDSNLLFHASDAHTLRPRVLHRLEHTLALHNRHILAVESRIRSGGLAYSSEPDAGIRIGFLMVKTTGRINPCTGRREPLTINVCSRIGRVPGHVCKLHPVIRGIAVSITYRHLIAHRSRVINRLLEGYAAPIVIIGNIYPILCLIVTYGNRSTVFLKLSRLLVRHCEEGHRLTD